MVEKTGATIFSSDWRHVTQRVTVLATFGIWTKPFELRRLVCIWGFFTLRFFKSALTKVVNYQSILLRFLHNLHFEITLFLKLNSIFLCSVWHNSLICWKSVSNTLMKINTSITYIANDDLMAENLMADGSTATLKSKIKFHSID